MSLPIKSTPTLYGEDSKRFQEQLKENENKKASPEELKRIKDNYESMKKIIDKSQSNKTSAVLEAPYFDENGMEIKEFAVLKVFHFIGARRKKHYMYKWVRIVEDMGKRYFYAQHLEDASGFFEKSITDKWTGYGLRGVANPERKIIGTEVVQCFAEAKQNKEWKVIKTTNKNL
jgi:hypothetical protein